MGQKSRKLFIVFALLTLLIITVFVAGSLINLFHAIRLSRYECTILASVEVDDIQIAGTIEVLGKRGLSFQPLSNAPETHTDLLVEGVRVHFLTEKYNFPGQLTKKFHDGLGFQLLVTLTLEQLTELLALSDTPPRRKKNFKRKKKPAKPVKVALALKSNSSAAD